MKVFSANYRVYYEDTDSIGLVYYANYLKFFERARTDFLRQRNLIQSELAKHEKLLFLVRKCQVDYKVPARLDDLISVSVVIEEVRPASIKIRQEMSKQDRLLAATNVEVVVVDSFLMKPKKLPTMISSKLIQDI